MILVDTSVWISLLRRKPIRRLSIKQLFNFVTCGPVIQEVLQGLRENPSSDVFREDFLAITRVSDPVPLQAFLEGAEIYRRGRRKGYTIRSSMDCLIAAIALENDVPVWHEDRDFGVIARFTGLKIYTGTTSR